MIRTTYKGRPLKILKSPVPGCVKQVVGDRVTNDRWQGTQEQALDNLKTIIDGLDETGPRWAGEEAPHWWPASTNTTTGRR